MRFPRFVGHLTLGLLSLLMVVPARAQQQSTDEPPAEVNDAATSEQVHSDSEQAHSEGRLRLNFRGSSWEDVLQWLADQADLSLQIDRVPQGTVNFVDPEGTYSVKETLDLFNRLLLDRGWALVRRGRMLFLIDLEAENANKLIAEQAERVAPEELEKRGNSDIVTCIFPLGGLDPEDAREELAEMVGPWGDVVVLATARQVKVTETVAKLKAIRELLSRATESASNVTTIPLEHRAAEAVLEVARPLLGLEPGENAGDEIRISVTVYGDRIFATGVPAKLGLLEKIVKEADQPLPTAEPDAENRTELPVLRRHAIKSAATDVVMDVLQTMLDGVPDVRIAVEPKTNSIIASARPETQELISRTIAELDGSGSSFEVIDLKRLEPQQALATINKFFGVSSAGGESGAGTPAGAPVIDGDPVTGRLWVRGTPEQIETVKRLIDELEGDNGLGTLGEKVRVLPFAGRSAEEAVSQVQRLWELTGRRNRIRTAAPSRGFGASRGIRERRPAGENGSPRDRPADKESGTGANQFPENPEASKRDRRETRLVSDLGQGPVASPSDRDSGANSSARSGGESDAATEGEQSAGRGGDDVYVQVTPRGLVVASEDTEALDTFETLLQSVSQPSAAPSELPTIYWLKYIEADVAAELVSDVLGGADSGGSSIAESVVSGLGGGMLGGLLGMGGGESESSARSILTSTGSVNVVPDARLNALIVQANPTDLALIEMILEKIDVRESPEDIETIAKPALIPVIYQDAGEVAELVKAVFAEKMGGGDEGGDRGRRGNDDMPSPREFLEAMRGGGRGGGGGGTARSEPTKISVAVDERSNSLVVTATPQDFLKVRDFVGQLDQQGMDTQEDLFVMPIPGTMKPDLMKQALESLLGEPVGSTGESGGAASGGARRDDGDDADDEAGPSPEEIRRRIEAFRQRFGGGRGGRGGGRGGRGGGGRGGAPGGGGRF